MGPVRQGESEKVRNFEKVLHFHRAGRLAPSSTPPAVALNPHSRPGESKRQSSEVPKSRHTRSITNTNRQGTVVSHTPGSSLVWQSQHCVPRPQSLQARTKAPNCSSKSHSTLTKSQQVNGTAVGISLSYVSTRHCACLAPSLRAQFHPGQVRSTRFSSFYSFNKLSSLP